MSCTTDKEHLSEIDKFKEARSLHLPVPKVLVIYTGGTIGMRIKNAVYAPKAGYLEKALRRLIILNDAETAFPDYKSYDEQAQYLYLPTGPSFDSVAYILLEYEELVDSSCMNFAHYNKIAEDIKENYDYFCGFVILHGTDTMAYTASHLSFMLENLGKPVILTGSQIPIFETRSDARDNVIGALMLAGLFHIPEVSVYFNSTLLRGNRSTKIDSQGLHAFDSPNHSVLATVDYTIKVFWDVVRPQPTEPFTIFTRMDTNIGLFRIFPGVRGEMLRSLWKSKLKAIVLQTYGMGNVPVNDVQFLNAIEEISNAGTVIVNCTQCQKGCVDAIYEAGAVLPDKGVLSGNDMTIECALAKMAYIFGHDEWELNYKRRLVTTSLRGELTGILQTTPRSATENSIGCSQCCLNCAIKSGSQEYLRDLLATAGCDLNSNECCTFNPLVDAIFSKQTSSIEILIMHGAKINFDDTFIGMFICRAAKLNDVESLKCWQKAGATLAELDYAGNSALKIAKLNNANEAIELLVNAAAGSDRNGVQANT